MVDQVNNPDCRQILGGAVVADAFSIDSDGSCGGASTSTAVYLAPLALNAPGSVETHAIPSYSAAVNAGDPGQCLGVDARAVIRNKDSQGCDVGAFEAAIAYPDGMYTGQLKVRINQTIVNLTDVEAITTGAANLLTEVLVSSARAPRSTAPSISTHCLHGRSR